LKSLRRRVTCLENAAARHRKIEQARREREEQFRIAFEKAKDAIFWADPKTGLITNCNQAAEILLERKKINIIGQPQTGLHPPAKAAYYASVFKKHIEKKGAADEEAEIITPSGKIKPVHITASIARIGQKAFIQGIFRDITERKKAEEKLIQYQQHLEELVEGRTAELKKLNLDLQQELTERKRSAEALSERERQFKNLFQNVPAGIYRTTPDGKILMANQRLIQILGFSSFQELSDRNLENWGFASRNLRNRFKKMIDRDGEVINFESRWLNQENQAIYIRESAKAFRDPDGRVLYYEGIVEDISKQKQLEEQLHQSQKMEAVGRLAGGIAHDFNNLLTVILGNTELLMDMIPAADPKKKDLEEIKKSSERAASLTHQLLAFSRKQILQPKVLSLNEIIQNLEEMLHRLIGEDVDLAVSLDPNLDRTKADPGQLEQVIMNLVVNARDAMPTGGKLNIETANVELDADYAQQHTGAQPGPYVMLAVNDTGMGMDEKTQAQAFEPFFTTKEIGKGTGLGLSTVYGIIKQSGGSIWLYSEPGQGTSFKIYLQRIEEKIIVSDSPETPEDIPWGSETVLVVEDETSVRELLEEFLNKCGYEVLAARQAEEAVTICEHYKGPIHLLITDIIMPKMNGRQLAEYLTNHYPETRVLYISGYTDDFVFRHGELEPDMDFLQKPFSFQTLMKKVRQVLDAPERVKR